MEVIVILALQRIFLALIGILVISSLALFVLLLCDMILTILSPNVMRVTYLGAEIGLLTKSILNATESIPKPSNSATETPKA